MEEGVGRFLRDLRKKCLANKVKLRFVRAKTVDNNGYRCRGYCGEDEIAIARRNPNWLGVVVHESCHLDQCLEGSRLWTEDDRYGNGVLEKYLSGKAVESLRKAINTIIRLELDCERRAIKKIVQYDLPINTITYIQKANAYLLYYNYVYEVCEWRPGVYDKPEIYQKMPSCFMKEEYYYKKLTNRVRKIFRDNWN